MRCGDRYRLIRELGRGGAAVVYLVEDRIAGQEVALKCLRDGSDAQRLERVRREVQAGRLISHPGLVRVYDLVETPEGPAIAMEAVNGPTLRQVLRERGALPLQEALAIHGEILTALEALHGANLLHRDIKPENIFLPAEGGVKVGDYSICLPLDRTRLTAVGAVVGTTGYMAPEQIEGGKVRPASDLYAAALVLYEMIAGRRPFEGDTPTQTLYAQLHHAPGMEALKQVGAHRWLRAYLGRCLARRAQERFTSVRRALMVLETHRVRLAPVAVARRLGLAALAALAILGAWWGGRVVWEPVTGTIALSGAKVSGLDKKGNPLWRRSLGAPPAAFLSEDLDGDGEQEAFAIGAGPYKVGHTVPLKFIRSGGEMVPVGGFPEIDGRQGLGGGYRAALSAQDLDGDGFKEVLGYLYSVWYPTQAFVYSVRFGKITISVFHPGHLAETVFEDVTGDGILDILVRSMNNALGHEGVLGALDGANACAGQSFYSSIVFMPGWRNGHVGWNRALAFYTFLPHEEYVFSARSGTFKRVGRRWSITPDHFTYIGDGWGNLDPGPTQGMGAEGQKFIQDFFSRVQEMMEAGTAGDRTRAAPEDWILPARFQGREPWDRVFRLVQGRELIRCGEAGEGLRVLEALASERPLDQEVNELLGVQTFLATGDWERGSALSLKNAARARFIPAPGRVTTAKIRALAGRLTPEDLDQLEDDFSGNCGQLERARILLALGRWAEAQRTALSIPVLSPLPYRMGEPCCLAMAEAATTGLTAQTLKRARAEADEYPDLVPIRTVAEAVEAARRGGPGGKAQAEILLAPVRKMAAWDLDARLCVAAYEQAVSRPQ